MWERLFEHYNRNMPSLMTENGIEIVGLEVISSEDRCEGIMERTCNNNFGSSSNPAFDVLDTNSCTRSASTAFTPASSALDQYRLQLYNYALHMERLRYIPMEQSQQHQGQSQFNTLANSSGNGYSPSYVSSPRLALSLFPQHIFKAEDPKPQHSYIGLIAMAILSTAELKLVLSDIYQYILDNYPYFRTRGPGWRNSIRHNLSLNDCFVKSGRSANGKGHYWAIHPANMDDFRKGDFRRRKAQRKVRKHMGLSVDDTGTDSPSPPPLDLSSPPSPPGPTLLSTAHSFTVTQQIAAFNYLQQRQQPITIVGPQIANQYLNLRPFSARYYITASPSSAVGTQKPDTQNNSSNKQKSLDSFSPANMIENFYTHSRKRQFDVASLLAPDVTTVSHHDAELSETPTIKTAICNVGEEINDNRYRAFKAERTRTTQVQHTVITKVTMNECNHQNMEQEFNDDQNEDIDVVDIASDIDIEEHENCHQENLTNANNDDRFESSDQNAINAGEITDSSIEIRVLNAAEAPNSIYTSTSDSRQSPFSDVTTNAELITNPLTSNSATSLVVKSLKVESNSKTSSNLNFPHEKIVQKNENERCHNDENNRSNNSMDPFIFGRYYGTYMAAAARRLHISTAFQQ